MRAESAPRLIAAFVVAVAVPVADAAEWQVTGTASQRIEVDTNRNLTGEPTPVYGSVTRFDVAAVGVAPRQRLDLGAGFNASVFAGPGDTDGLGGIDPRFSSRFTYDGKRVDFGTGITLAVQPVAFAQIEETGATEGDATQLNVTLSSDVAVAMDARNRLTLGGSVALVRFTDGTTSLTPTTTIGLTLGWVREINASTGATLTFGIRRFTADSLENPRSLTFDTTLGFRHRANRRLAINSSVGFTATTTERDVGQDTGLSFGFNGGFDMEWRATRASNFQLGLTQGLEPSSLGELQTTTRLSFGWDYQVNATTRFGLDLSYLRQRSAGDFEENGTSRDQGTVGASLAFDLGRDWGISLGYTLRLTEDEDSSGVSHRGALTLTRNFDFLR